jgi:hypothetical protein
LNDLSEKLRKISLDLRVKSIPLSDIIPLLQKAADRIDELESLQRNNDEK